MNKETKVGLLALISIIIGYFGFQFLKGLDIFSKTNNYYVFYPDVQGLKASNLVTLNGVAVGRVEQVIALPQQNRVQVLVNIKKEIPLSENTEAVLFDESLLGGKAIRLNLVAGKRSLAESDTLKGTKEVSLTDLLKEKALPLVKNADSLIITLNQVVGTFKGTATYLNKVLATTDQTLATTGSNLNGTIAENRIALKAALANVQTLTADLVQTQKMLTPILGKFNTLSDSLTTLRLGNTLNKVNQNLADLEKILASVEKGNGTLGKMAKDEALYRNLNNVASNLDRLLINFKQEPKRYVHFSLFGKKNTPPNEKPILESDSLR